MAAKRPRPTLKAAIICDQAIKEAGTNKWTLVGTFNQIFAPVPKEIEELAKSHGKEVGITHHQLGIYFCVDNAEGDYPIEIQIVKLNAEELLVAKVDANLNAKSRLLTSDFAVHLRNVQLPGFGRYSVKLLMDAQFIGHKTLDVLRINPMTPKTT